MRVPLLQADDAVLHRATLEPSERTRQESREPARRIEKKKKK